MAQLFDKILIANRGEIALRVISTCRKLGIKTVAVYSEADTNALHVREADEAVYIGPSPAIQSYLCMDNIMAAIHQTGAQAVHPGYGFLSENAEFCARLEKEGIAFIGPKSNAIRKMGDKIESKIIARKAGVNTVPGTTEAIDSEAKAIKTAKSIGYPVMIKAAAGGGGKGMRVARNQKELIEGLKMASSEAGSSFGDRRVFIEKYFDNPRHIEIQVLGDNHGNIVYLGERECSIQRRHQKVIEEAPSTFIDEATRKKMGKQSVALAKEVGYSSAGTVEFIVDQKGNFYFLEMNTRLQVEHRVTELITGLDLVEQMIRVAAGEKLKFAQKDVHLNGWAFECRVYAEDPTRGFLPSIGRITRYQQPPSEPNLLIDTGVYEGGEVSMFYDPMISKVCTHAPTREQAIEAMQSALSAYIIRGVSHNITFLEAILGHERFKKGDISTSFIDQEYPEGFAGATLTTDIEKVFLSVGVHIFLRDAERASQITGQLPGRGRAIGTLWVVAVGDHMHPVHVRPREHGYDISYDNGLLAIRSSWRLGRRLFQGTLNGKPISVRIKHLNEGYVLSHAGAEVRVVVRTSTVAELAQYMKNNTSVAAKQSRLLAPLAGRVVSMKHKEGDVVKAGYELVIIEAMKMENIIHAEADVRIKSVKTKEGDSISADDLLFEFEPTV